MRYFVTLLILLSQGTNVMAQWAVQTSGTKDRLRGLNVFSEEIIWASGTNGTFLRTIDGGTTWKAGTMPGAASLDFRDVHAFDEKTVLLLSIGPGEQSRIYKTTDGGANWATVYVNKDPKGFLDVLAFWDADLGLVLGDLVDGRFVILGTADGGKTWEPISPEGMPPALPGEGAFAASGTCLVVGKDGHAWFGTGGAKVSRVFRSSDRGRTWTVHETQVMAGTSSSGIFSLAFQDAEHGIVVGGDYKESDRKDNVVALTSDGGRTWRLPKGQGPGGYRSAVAFVPGSGERTLIAVGPTGSDVSVDGGENWKRLGETGFNAVGFAGPSAGWAVGDEGLVARFEGAEPRRQ